jgi:carboxylesterase
MKNPFRFRGWVALGLCLGACQLVSVECDKECQEGWLDGGGFRDECLDTLTVKCRVSDRIPAPTEAQKESLQVVIAVHGYTASSFEWKEFADFIDTVPEYANVAVSRIVLGGHGQDLDAFQTSTWRIWGAPILAEYDSLAAKGYKHISFACASTGCALLMQYLNDGAFSKRQAPKWIFMIDPIVVPTQKILSLVDIVGPILGNSPNPGTDQENRHWYVNRPQETLQELYDLINRVKNELEDGFKLPRATQAKVYKSKHDNNADPVGALLIFKGLRNWDGSHLEVEMEDSRLHVFTRLEARSSPPTPERRALQVRTFREMAERALKP